MRANCMWCGHANHAGYSCRECVCLGSGEAPNDVRSLIARLQHDEQYVDAIDDAIRALRQLQGERDDLMGMHCAAATESENHLRRAMIAEESLEALRHEHQCCIDGDETWADKFGRQVERLCEERDAVRQATAEDAEKLR